MPLELVKLKTQRAVFKRKITQAFKEAESKPSAVSGSIKLVEGYLQSIADLDNLINNVMSDGSEEIDDEFGKELDNQSSYSVAILSRLSDLSKIGCGESSSSSHSEDALGCGALKLPELSCESFSGEGNNQMEYHTFITKFKSIIGSRQNLSSSIKLTYLRSYLKGYALKIVQHLIVSDINYDVALALLDTEFLNKDEIIENLLAKFLNLKIKYDHDFLGTKIYLTEIRCIISDLESYGVDLNNGGGNILVSHIVFHKMPYSFQQELVRKLGNYYPTVTHIFDNYVDIIRTLNMKQNRFSESKSNVPIRSKLGSFSNEKFSGSRYVQSSISKTATVKGANATPKFEKPEFTKFCKFCTSLNHSMTRCIKYKTFAERKVRCEELGMCSKCSSSKHTAGQCTSILDFKCNTCNSNRHISALCNKLEDKVSVNYCINAATDSGRTFLLPVLCVKVNCGDKTTNVNCLLDTGSQRSYINSRVLTRLGIQATNKNDFKVSTFLDSVDKSFSCSSLNIDLNEDNKGFLIPFLVDESLDISFKIDGLRAACRNISQIYTLGFDFSSDEVKLDGLLGVDSIQCFNEFKMISCIGGVAYKLKKYVVPYGNIDSFLSSSQLEKKYETSRELAEDEVVSVDCSLVNFVMNPSKTFFDPIGPVISDGLVEDRLDKMFSVESLGIKEKFSDYDQEQLDKFNREVSFSNGKYYVALPWNDCIGDVPSNFNVCKSILFRVADNLRKNNLFEKYNEVLMDQLTEGILEKVPINTSHGNVFIPHRPVVKLEDTCTTKLRIVLNCSLKTNGKPSLNQAAYAGVDLLNNLTSLLIKFRFGKYFMMGDVRRAFLMILLKNEFDKSKFNILWFDENNELIAYRYKSIVFGYSASPFILNHVIKLHLKKFPDDEVSQVLDQNIYVDNLVVSGNDEGTLCETYRKCVDRMLAGGFDLRQWASNSSLLSGEFESDGRGTTHSSDFDKILGYSYNCKSDKIVLANFDKKIHSEILTKRIVLSYVSRLFDPIGLYTPVTMRGKLLVNELWQSKLGWDEPLSNELGEKWFKLKTDLDSLSTLKFSRYAYDESVDLIFFCDGSKLAYGFACYARSVTPNKVSSNLVFAKTKVAPVRHKLPTIELLSAFLAVKSLPLILDSMKGKVLQIIIAVDAQVPLSWILTCNVKCKNIFAKNRVTEIKLIREQISKDFGLDCKFKYVPTELNPSDLLTRGLSLDQFKDKFEFWYRGPKFLLAKDMLWPTRDLKCLSEVMKTMTMTSVVKSTTESIFDVEKYSDVNKLFRVTAICINFIAKLKKKP